jgi:hypothetical protein
MKLNKIEFLLMNNSIRALVQSVVNEGVIAMFLRMSFDERLFKCRRP